MTLSTITVLAFVVLTAQIAILYPLWYARNVVSRMTPLWIATALAGLLTTSCAYTWLYLVTLLGAVLTVIAGVRLAYGALPERNPGKPSDDTTDTSGFE